MTPRFSVAQLLAFLSSSDTRLPGLLASALLDSVAIAIVSIHGQLAEVPTIVKRTN